MSDILCIYYSRTGHTKQAVEDIAAELKADVAELRDGVPRLGWKGWLRCGLDAVRMKTLPVEPLKLEKPLSDYKLVILGTPIWAGRCSAVMRSFLKTHGKELPATAYVITRSSEERYEEVFRQMDRYLNVPRKAAVSLRTDSAGYPFWKAEFLRQLQELQNVP